MKTLARCCVMLFLMGVSSTYAQEWIPYQQYAEPVPQMVYVQQPQPVLVYQYVPYTVQQNIVVEKRCLFVKTQTVVTRPVTQWIYQPVVVYR